ncbi:MAG: hypothetical protein QXI16_05975 [Sulfolobaceae archaeon]
MSDLNFNPYIDTLQTDYNQIRDIADKLSKELSGMLNTTIKVPNGRMSLAELINSYTQLKKAQIDIIKAQADLSIKQTKQAESSTTIEISNDLLWKIQKLQRMEEK